tara:strand:- start:2428 stop:2664 length:237 start_codon:yes stop_codon:yes gene_type:complete
VSLGKIYANKFKIGDLVSWKVLNFEGNEYARLKIGLIVEIFVYEKDLTRPVHYAGVLEPKTGEKTYIVLSCLTKVETN